MNSVFRIHERATGGRERESSHPLCTLSIYTHGRRQDPRGTAFKCKSVDKRAQMKYHYIIDTTSLSCANEVACLCHVLSRDTGKEQKEGLAQSTWEPSRYWKKEESWQLMPTMPNLSRTLHLPKKTRRRRLVGLVDKKKLVQLK